MKFKIKKLRKSAINKLKIKNTIQQLFDFGFSYSGKDKEIVWQKIGNLIWKLKLSYRIKLPLKIKRFLCRKCNTLLIPSKTLRVRNFRGAMEYKCLNCGFVRRYRIKHNS